MSHKILGLLALAVTALVALPAVAQATTVTSPTGTSLTGESEAQSEGHIRILNPIVKTECNIKVRGTITTHGEGVTAKGPVTEFAIALCTNSWHVTASTLGYLEAHYTSGYDATITAGAGKVAATRFGVVCTYETNNTDMGTATGGNPTTMHINATVPIVAAESSPLCGKETTKVEGSYEGTSSAYYDA